MASHDEGLEVTNSPDHSQALNNGVAEKTPLDTVVLAKSSEPELKSAPVSVIQTAPPRVNGVSDQNHTEEAGKEKQNTKVSEENDKEALSIQPATEQLPAELLDQEEKEGGEASSLTTVASLVDQEEAAAKEEATAAVLVSAAAPKSASDAVVAAKSVTAATTSPVKAVKTAAADISADWEEEDGGDVTPAELTTEKTVEESPTATADMVVAVETPKTGEEAAVVNKSEQQQKKETKPAAAAAPTPRKSGRPPKPSTKKVESEEMEEEMEGEESVDAIAKELERTSGPAGADDDDTETPKAKKTAAATKSPKSAKAAVESEETDQDGGKVKRKGRPKKKDLDEKVEHVTKLGNNMYFYTGPGGQDSPPPLQSDEEDMDVSEDVRNKKEKEAAAAEASRKSSRPGKGRNPRLEREDEEVDMLKKTPVKPNLNPGWLKKAAKSMPPKGAKTPTNPRTKRCKECEACRNENCGECENCKDMIKFGGPNKKRKPCVRRMCKNLEEVKSPEISTPAVTTPKAAKTKATSGKPAAGEVKEEDEEEEVEEGKEVEKETIAAEASPPRDEELPEFDPAQFTPGYVPKTIKKGEDEYMIVVQGVQDTGLCGKYWGDLNNLPSRRRSKLPEAFKAGESPEPGAAGRRGSVGSTGSSETPTGTGKRGAKKQDTQAAGLKSAAKKQITKPEKVNNTQAAAAAAAAESSAGEESGAEGAAAAPAATEAMETDQTPQPAEEDSAPQPKKRGRKRKVVEATEPDQEKKTKLHEEKIEDVGASAASGGAPADQETAKEGSPKKKGGSSSKSSPEKTAAAATATPRNVAAVSAALAIGAPAGQQRSVSCVADTSTQKEVVVECFAPYDDHRWVNIGKERDGMTPDAVQYARALRPPYHLLSFLRIKGHSTKGMSCTDKNTMVFVVLEGEITVILHTTQFNAKKGDSFYIPPKNYYNLINQKAREAELSLIQFQYDGPLPTVSPAQSQ